MPGTKLSTISGFPLFDGMRADALEDLLARSRTVRVSKDKPVFVQGAEAVSFFVLLDGYVRATKTTFEGDEMTVRYVSPGEIFGVAPAIGQNQYPATAVAVIDAMVLAWRSSDWSVLSERYPILAANVLRAVGSRLQDAHARMIELTGEEVERRIARALLRLADQAGRKTEAGVEIEFPLRRQDIAQLTGTTLHSASRILSSWRQREVLAGDRGRVIVRNSGALHAIAEGGAT